MRPRLLTAVLVLLLAAPATAEAAVSTGDAPQSGGAPVFRPSPTTPPSLAGTATTGSTLTATTGSWPSGTTLDYIWLRCSPSGSGCAQVAGRTLTYTLSAADEGRLVKFRVRGTGSLGGYNERDTAGIVGAAPPVAPTPPSVLLRPSINGIFREGSGLAAVTGTWTGTSPITYEYVWASCAGTQCRSVSTATSYTPTRSDVGRKVFLGVTARNVAGSAFAVSDGVTVSAIPTIKRLSPFPTLLVDGRVAGAVTSISTLRLRKVPGGSTINLACSGRGCPFRKSRIRVRSGKSRTVALKKLQRRMRANSVVVITVRKGDTLGKYIRLRFRRGSAPARVDRCVEPKSSKPIKCP